MNKKIFTLIAGLLLSAGVSTMSAQSTPNYALASEADLTQEIVNGKYFQLAVDDAASATPDRDHVLAMYDLGNGEYQVVMEDLTSSDVSLPNTLWKTTVTKNEEGGISYTFTNVATNMPLGFDAAAAVKPSSSTALNPTIQATVASGNVVGVTTWKWQASLTTTSTDGFPSVALTTFEPFANRDSVMMLSATEKLADGTDATSTVEDGVVVGAVKYAPGNMPTVSNEIFITPVLAGPVLLGVDDLNSMLWTMDASGKVKFSFETEVANSEVGNLWTKNSYKAVKAVGYPADARAVSGSGTAFDPTTGLAVAATAIDGPQTPVADYTALQAVEVDLKNAKADNTLANAIAKAMGTDLVDQSDVADAVAGIAFTVDGATASKEDLIEEIKDQPAVNDFDDAVRNAVIAFINSRTDVVTDDSEAQDLLDAATEATAGAIAYDIAEITTPAAMKTALDAFAKDVADLEDDREDVFATVKETFDGTDSRYALNGWISLMYEEDKDDAANNTYLAVDTKYLTKEGGLASWNLGFATKTFKDVGVCDYTVVGDPTSRDVARLDLNGRYNFQFYYYPTQDSIVIRTGGWGKKRDNQAAWTDMNIVDNPELDDTKAFAASGSLEMEQTGAELNLIKLAVLSNKPHREVTVGSSEPFSGVQDTKSTINTRIYIGGNVTDNRTTLADGLYFITLKSTTNAENQANVGGYKIVHINEYTATTTSAQTPLKTIYAKEDDAQQWGSIQNFAYMPATQWVVEQSTFGEAGKELVNIYNREYPAIRATNIQLYLNDKGAIVFPRPIAGAFSMDDAWGFSHVKDVKSTQAEINAAYGDEYLGYFQKDSVELSELYYNLDYLSGIQLGNLINVSNNANDTVLRVNVNGEKVDLVFETAPVVAEGDYGYNSILTTDKTRKMFPQLRRTAYVLKVKDANKLANDSKYVVKVGSSIIGEPVYAISKNATKYTITGNTPTAVFFLKENNRLTIEGESVPYYALVDATPTNYTNKAVWNETFDDLKGVRMGVKDGSLYVTQEYKEEKRVAAFALITDKTPLYRRLGVTDPNDGFNDNDTNLGKVYRINSTEREYLYEDAWSKYSTVNKDGKEPSMGINFLGVEGKGDNANAALFVDTAYVRYETNMPQYMFAVRVTEVPKGMRCPVEEHNSPEYIAAHGDCGHKVPTEGYRYGDYLINAIDSVVGAKNGKDYEWETEYTRLAFVPAKHIADTLIMYRDGKASTESVDSIFLGDNLHNKTTAADGDHRLHHSHENGIKNPVFALRLINDEPQADFLIESEGDKKIPSAGKGGWVKIQNGVPVIARLADFNQAILNAEKFNIELTDEKPVSNETISTTGVEVIAVNGAVIVKNAAGKAVAISNILGKVLANTVINSDEATISVPAGIVVVAVEGEEAVKAIVK